MTIRKKLIEILKVPIYPHEQADPAEVVADYLLDNDVVPVVRCKDCKHIVMKNGAAILAYCPKINTSFILGDINMNTHFCSLGERKKDA